MDAISPPSWLPSLLRRMRLMSMPRPPGGRESGRGSLSRIDVRLVGREEASDPWS